MRGKVTISDGMPQSIDAKQGVSILLLAHPEDEAHLYLEDSIIFPGESSTSTWTAYGEGAGDQNKNAAKEEHSHEEHRPTKII